jgi:hypothetical protein
MTGSVPDWDARGDGPRGDGAEAAASRAGDSVMGLIATWSGSVGGASVVPTLREDRLESAATASLTISDKDVLESDFFSDGMDPDVFRTRAPPRERNEIRWAGGDAGGVDMLIADDRIGGKDANGYDQEEGVVIRQSKEVKSRGHDHAFMYESERSFTQGARNDQ